jgi:hypothetical protein
VQFLPGKPANLDDLAAIGRHRVIGGRRPESDHQAGRERPWLGAGVIDAVEQDTGFFAQLTADRVLQRSAQPEPSAEAANDLHQSGQWESLPSWRWPG